MIEALCHSEPGGHIENQDAFDARPHPLDADCNLCVVADGQGGRSGAGAAAKLACKVVIEQASALRPQDLLRPNVWKGVLEAADHAVEKDPAAGFTTLVGLCIVEGQVCGASNGDSAAILIGPRQPATILTAHQHKNPPIGSGAVSVVGFTAKLNRPWKVMVMTDGVWKYVGFERVMKLAFESQGQELISVMLDNAKLPRNRTLQDDFTVVLLPS
jgi:serine/threonine protein phosphatase PrpC